MDLSAVMGEHREQVEALAGMDADIATAALSVQMAVLNQQPTALRVLLAAIYIAGQLSVDDARPDPEIWDIDLSPGV